MSTPTLNLYRADPLLRLLRDRWKWTVIHAAIIPPVIMLIYQFGYCTLNQCLVMTGRVGLLADYQSYVNVFIGTTTVFAFYLWLPDGIQRIFIGLYDIGIIQKTRPDSVRRFGEDYSYLDFLKRVERTYNWPGWFIVSFGVAGVSVVLFTLPEHLKFAIWWNQQWYTLVITNLGLFLQFGLAFLCVIRILLTIWWMQQLFTEFVVVLRPLYPDHAGGLGAVGSFIVMTGYLIGAYGIVIVFNAFTQDYVKGGQLLALPNDIGFYLALFAYGVIAPIAFVVLLRLAHSAMRDAKYAHLLNIEKQFEKEYKEIQGLLESDAEQLKIRMDKIKQLQELSDLTRAFPEWPFRIHLLFRFSFSVLSPFLLAILTKIVEGLITFP